MKYLLILIPLFVFSGEYYDLCNGKEYTVSKNVLIASSNKDHNITETGIPFAPWIYCTDKDMNITTPIETTPKTLNINGHVYKLQDHQTSLECVPFGDKHYIHSKKIYWRKCRRYPTDWQET